MKELDQKLAEQEPQVKYFTRYIKDLTDDWAWIRKGGVPMYMAHLLDYFAAVGNEIHNEFPNVKQDIIELYLEDYIVRFTDTGMRYYCAAIANNWGGLIYSRTKFVTYNFVDPAEVRPCVKLDEILDKTVSRTVQAEFLHEVIMAAETPNILSIEPDEWKHKDIHKFIGRVYYDSCFVNSFSESRQPEIVRSTTFYQALKLELGD